MGGTEIVVVWFSLALAGAVATVWWSVRSWKRRRDLNRWAKVLAGIVAASAVLGSVGTLVGLLKVWGATGGTSVDPSQTARVLAEGISEAISCTAAGLLVWLPSVVALTVVGRINNGRSG